MSQRPPIPDPPPDPDRLVLALGRVTASADGRRVAVGTDAAEAEAVRESFALASSGPGSARVEAVATTCKQVQVVDTGTRGCGRWRLARTGSCWRRRRTRGRWRFGR